MKSELVTFGTYGTDAEGKYRVEVRGVEKPKPYFEERGATLYCGDNAAILPMLPSESIDLTVTSPPYDNLRTYNGYSFDFETVAKELYRVTKTGGVVVWVVGDATVNGSETGTSFRQALFFKDECGFNLHDTMIYQTNKPPMNDNRYQQEFEYMFVFIKEKLKTFNVITVPSLHPGIRNTGGHRRITGEKTIYQRRNERTADWKPKGNIWYLPRSSNSGDEASTLHPATFPEALASDHIRSWSNPGDTVLDPFCGSCTTGKMALKNGCKFIGIEVSEEYCSISARRLSQGVLAFG